MHFCPVSQVLGLDTSYLYSGKTCTEGSKIQAGVWSSGAVILEWFHLILAMGDWLKSLKNQCDWVTGLCNGPVPGQGLSSLVTKLEQTGIAVRQSRSSLQLCHLQKTSARFQWETPGPWRSQDRSQVLLRQRKPPTLSWAVMKVP